MFFTEIDISWVINIANKAGKIALSHFGNTHGTLKMDNSWVTQADVEVESYIRKELVAKRPKDSILGEEEYNPYPESPMVWAVDPIDGTRAFNHGFPVWGISIGLLENGIPRLGVFSLPALGDVYHTDGINAFYNGKPLLSPESIIDANAIFLFNDFKLENLGQNRDIRYPNYGEYLGKFLSFGSAAAHLCYVARGSAIATLEEATIWDYAASAAILRVLGIPFRYLSGTEVDFSGLYNGKPVSEPTLVCNKEHFKTLQRIIKKIG